MADQSQGRHDADSGMPMFAIRGFVNGMNGKESLEDVEEEKSDDQGDHRVKNRCVKLPDQLDNFRKNIEGDHPQKNAGREAKNQMKLVPVPEAGKPPHERREKGKSGEDDDHDENGPPVFIRL